MKRKDDVNSDLENNDAQNEESGHKQEALADSSIELTDQVAKLEAELTESRDKYLRLYSDFENFKKRVTKDRIEYTKMAGSEVFLSFLPIIDDLERALKSSETATDSQPIKEGIKLIYSKIKSISESKGLKEMVSVNQLFDAELHDAIANLPAPSEAMKGKVIEEIEKGYYFNDKVIRHAKVIVGN